MGWSIKINKIKFGFGICIVSDFNKEFFPVWEVSLLLEKFRYWLWECLFFDIENKNCALNGTNLHRAFSLFQKVSSKVGYCLCDVLLYTLMIYHKHLHAARSGCFIGHQCINHVLYADDIRFLAPSALGL